MAFIMVTKRFDDIFQHSLLTIWKFDKVQKCKEKFANFNVRRNWLAFVYRAVFVFLQADAKKRPCSETPADSFSKYLGFCNLNIVIH